MDSKKRKIPACEVCQQPANQTCGGCKTVFYCSRNHQKTSWKDHKYLCRPFEVQQSDKAGRYLVATRDIKQGEIILREKPCVSGPRTASKPICLSCSKKLEPMQLSGETVDYYKCTSCNWPMCNVKCERSIVHREECMLMSTNDYKCNITYRNPVKAEAAYCVIAPLRTLLLKASNPETFKSIMNLESHLNERVNTQLYSVLKLNLVTFISQVLKLSFDEDTILRVASILDTNAFDVRSPDGLCRLRAVYTCASMINHNCTPNTRHIFLGDEHTLALIATVPVGKGETLTATYTQVLWGTLDRRKHLYSVKYFNCECGRCQDVTEFDTYIGSIYCSMCAGSKLQKPMMLSSNPLNATAPWKCEACGHCIESRQMFWGNNALKQDLNKMNKNGPHEFEKFIKTYVNTLHPKNHLVIQAKLALMQIYGNYEGYTLAELSDELLERKVEICHELLEVADKLEPGWSKFRGSILLELQAAMVVQTKRDFESDKITQNGAQDQLMESMVLLQEAVNILKVEPHMKEALERKVQELSSLMSTSIENI